MGAGPLDADLSEILERSASDLQTLKGTRIFITGGTGFVGSCLLETLCCARERLRLGLEMTLLTRDPERFRSMSPHLSQHPGVTLVRGDVTHIPEGLGTFDGVIHAATPASAALNKERPLEMLDTIVDGGRNALELASRSGSIPFLFTSSGAVYGRQPPDVAHTTESYAGGPDVLAPGNAYSEGKRVGELQCALYAQSGLQVKIARLFAFVGPYLPLDRHFAIGNFIGDGLSGRDITVSGDGSTVRSYLHASEMVIWLLAIYARGEPLRPYNVGSEEAVDISTLAAIVARAFENRPQVRILGKKDPHRTVDRYVPSSLRVRSELGVEQRTGLEAAVRRTVDYHQAKRY